MKLAFTGPQDIALPVATYRKVGFTILSGGCAVIAQTAEGDSELIYAGAGKAKVKVSSAAARLLIRPFQKDGAVALDVPELRDIVGEAGWRNEPSLTDLSPKPFGMISPEIQAVMDAMNRNAIIREQAMLRALGRRGEA